MLQLCTCYDALCHSKANRPLSVETLNDGFFARSFSPVGRSGEKKNDFKILVKLF